MQGGQGPGRGIYIARRIAVVLIVLLLLVLLVPRACDALLGTREEQSSEAPETADVESPSEEAEEETVTEGEAATVQEEITEREEVAVSDSEEEEEEATSEEAAEEGGVGAANIELGAAPVGPPIGLGGIPGGGPVVSVPQEVPPIVVGTGVPEPIPPSPAPQEPVLVGGPPVPEPIPVQEPIFIGEP